MTFRSSFFSFFLRFIKIPDEYPSLRNLRKITHCYTLVQDTRRCGGGIGLLYKDSLRATKVRNGEEESCELLVQISSSLKIRVVIVYRPPHSKDHRVPVVSFLNEFSSYMESIILSKDHLLILGDFNIHVDVPTDAYTVKFMDLLESVGLEQHVRGPTHTHGHILDLVIT